MTLPTFRGYADERMYVPLLLSGLAVGLALQGRSCAMTAERRLAC